jgi:hypothetical protein
MKMIPLIQSTRILSLALLMAGLALTAGRPLLASPSTPQQADWGNLTKLTQGDEIKVVVDRGSSRQGTFQSVTDDEITVHFATGNQTLARQSVRQVMAKRGGNRGKHALIGMAVGAGAGLGLGAAADHFQSHQSLEALPMGAAVGAGIGALLPSGGWKTIYDGR